MGDRRIDARFVCFERGQVEALAQAIRDEQHTDIFHMQQWLHDWFDQGWQQRGMHGGMHQGRHSSGVGSGLMH